MDFNKNENNKEEKNDDSKSASSQSLFDNIPEDVLSEFKEELKEPTMGLMKRIVEVFTNPKEVMEDVKIKSNTGILLVIFALIGLLTALAILPIMKDAMLDLMIEQAGANNIDSAMLDNLLNFTVIFAIIGSSLGTVISPLISGIVSHVVAILSGGEGKFKQTIDINVMAYVVVMAGAILRVALVLVTKNMYASFSPAMLISGTNPTANPYYGILSIFELFNIVYLYFAFIGIKVIHNVSNVKAWVITLTPTIILVLISLVPLLMESL